MSWWLKLGRWLGERWNVPPVVLGYLQTVAKLGRPTEVIFPKELLPLALKTATQGFLNFNALQTHLDWVWPYWVVQQYDPASPAFIPRSFLGVSVNATHRNWTAIGLPGIPEEGIVDPRGLVTPWRDGWSLDTWVKVGGTLHCPSQAPSALQSLEKNIPIVRTEVAAGVLRLTLRAVAVERNGIPVAALEASLSNPGEESVAAELIFSVRPANPEGISPVHSLMFEYPGYFVVDGSLGLVAAQHPDAVQCSTMEDGDVVRHLGRENQLRECHCEAGLASGAIIYRETLSPRAVMKVLLYLPLRITPATIDAAYDLLQEGGDPFKEAEEIWAEETGRGMALEFPDPATQTLFQQARTTLLTLYDGEAITPGPFCYHSFWHRDAAFLVTALMKLGYLEESRNLLNTYPYSQQSDGFYRSQEGEWDSAGQALWTLSQYYSFTRDREFLETMYPGMARCAEWIDGKRLQDLSADVPHNGLFPAGLSAEHLGHNDYYYWDNFWGLAGLREVMKAAKILGQMKDMARFKGAFEGFQGAIDRSLLKVEEHLGFPCIPASVYRGLDCGAIGSLCALYPLELVPPKDGRIACTLDAIRELMFYDGLFFQQNVHSGGNPYLTLHVAHCLLDKGDPAAWDLFRRVREAASPTGCYPEAIHPRTGGGCMGDGHHGWAAAEIIHFLRDTLVRERDFRLDILPLPEEAWFQNGKVLSVKDAPCHFGSVTFRLESRGKRSDITIKVDYHTVPDEVRLFLPFAPAKVMVDGQPVEVAGESYPWLISCKPSVENIRIERR